MFIDVCIVKLVEMDGDDLAMASMEQVSLPTSID
jgi:hypothetical protein